VVFLKKANRANCSESGTPLNLLRITLGDEEYSVFTSSHRYDRWLPTRDFKYAFGLNTKDTWQYSVSVVNLKTDEAMQLPGESTPQMLPDSSCAFRVAERSGRRYLMRFEFTAQQDVPLCRVRAEIEVIAVSNSGSYALLGSPKLLSLPHYVVMHLPSGTKYQLRRPGSFGFVSGEMIPYIPQASPFSPDERTLVLQASRGETVGTLLYTLPDLQ
jgi:hypothetical protein